MNHSTLTLGELLTMSDEIIKRNAMSILKRLQVLQPEQKYSSGLSERAKEAMRNSTLEIGE